jgi:hypothetical protein
MQSSQKGNVVVALLVVLSITALEVYYAFTTHSRDANTTQRRHLVQGSVKEVLTAADQLLKSPKSFMNSVRGSLNKTSGDLEKCMSDGTYDCPAGGGPFSIYRDDASLLYSDAVNPDVGLNFSLQKCQGYSNPLDFFCAIKLKLIWKPECPASGGCFLPHIDIQGAVEIKSSFLDRMVFNTEPYTFVKRIR